MCGVLWATWYWIWNTLWWMEDRNNNDYGTDWLYQWTEPMIYEYGMTIESECKIWFVINWLCAFQSDFSLHLAPVSYHVIYCTAAGREGVRSWFCTLTFDGNCVVFFYFASLMPSALVLSSEFVRNADGFLDNRKLCVCTADDFMDGLAECPSTQQIDW